MFFWVFFLKLISCKYKFIVMFACKKSLQIFQKKINLFN